MSIPQRFYRIARYKLAELKDRFDRLDAEAQSDLSGEQRRRQEQTRAAAARELDEPLEGSMFPASGPGASALDPGRSGDRQGGGRGGDTLSGVSAPPPQSSGAPSGAADPLLYHYRLLGVAAGSDFAAVQTAYNRLSARCEASRFPSGSKEATEAEQIRERLDTSFRALRDALDPTARRFDLLEFDDAPRSGF